jgi:hypothetical protein
MDDYSYRASLGVRDAIAAWLVCLAVAMAVFIYPDFSLESARRTQAEPRHAAMADRAAELCALGRDPIAATPGPPMEFFAPPRIIREPSRSQVHRTYPTQETSHEPTSRL